MISEKSKIRIALDAMGGDFSPINEVHGALLAYKEMTPGKLFEIVFVGNESKIRSAISQFDFGDFQYSIINADDVVTMEDEPTNVLKNKRNSSLYKAMQLHKEGYADSFVSAGNTGAVLATATVLLGRINGVSRPTIGSFFPTTKSHPVLLLDVGANVDSKPRFLFEFSVMGSIYITQMFGLENPKVALLNIGEEKSKGTQTVLEAYQMLQLSNLNFVGNIEGRDIFSGASDVIVCDGFTGNIVLKFAESVMSFLKEKIKSYSKQSLFNKLMIVVAVPVLKGIFKQIDYQEYGGVPLLGVNGVVIIGHGKSTPKALKNMIFKAIEFVNKDVNGKIEAALNPSIVSNNE